MREFFVLVMQLVVAIARLMGPGGAKSIVAENLLLKQQLLVLSRTRRRAPQLSVTDRFLFGLWSLFLCPRRIERAAIFPKPATLLRFHAALVKRKYHLLFSPRTARKPGPKGPSAELIHAIVELKRRNPRFGCPRIAQQIAYTFGIEIDKDSLWSVDLFRCESIRLHTHWILVVMDQFTRRIIGFAVQAGAVDGRALCRMFNQAISKQSKPVYLSSDNDPLFLYHQWQANLRILEVDEIKTVPRAPSVSGRSAFERKGNRRPKWRRRGA